MGKGEERDKMKVEAVLQILRKQSPLTVKQEKFCNYACVERFLKAKGENVKKAAKHLRACLSWRDTIGTDHLIADEFSTELADGVAYVAGHDQEARPVMVFRIKQDYHKFHSQKMYIRLLVFTLEVAIGCMPRNVEQFVLLLDASSFRSASAFLNLLLASLKIISEYYPGRMRKAFIIDPPSHFSFLWKGVRAFVDLSASTSTSIVSSLDFEDSWDESFVSYPRASSLRFNPTALPTAKIGASSSSRFTFTVSNFDSLKPWYLSTSSPQVGFIPNVEFGSSPSLMGPALVSPLNARSYSFASPAGRSLTPRDARSFQPNPRTPRPSFLQSPAMFFRKNGQLNRNDKARDSFLPFLKFYRKPYDEMAYRSKMKPPLGGLISIVSPQLKRRQISASQRF
ncbi:uncharacterized protein [Aristolochia californica]|uniref:uncharacterized protein n=1 Tax=Aristolochia californica TaxID=171875 RepID=UPI0035DB3C98